MRSLQRVLLERKTRRFVDEMIPKYDNIRLSSATRSSRKRPRSHVGDSHKSDNNQEQERQTESSLCRTESDRSSWISSSNLESEQSQTGKSGRQQQQDEERLRESEAHTVSEYGSAFSFTRLTKLLEEDENGQENNQNEASAIREDLHSETSCEHGTEENQSFSECDTSSIYLESAPTSTQPSERNHTEVQSELAEQESPPSSVTRLPRLRLTAPSVRVTPNCCDFFTSPHPHYPKEGIGKVEGSSNSLYSGTKSIGSTESEADSDNSESSTDNNEDEEFDMWDYVCPQYLRRVYANEWV